LSHWEKIQLAAKDQGFNVNNPKSSCKHCYGRGYTGLWNVKNPDETITKMPNPCSCIYPKEVKQHFQPQIAMNRLSKRNYERKRVQIEAENKKMMKKMMKTNNTKFEGDLEVESIDV
jgi:hypothetical protein